MPGEVIRPVKKKLDRRESVVQAAIIRYLRARQWYVKETHGNWYQSGFPDLYATHARKGPRWIEVKDPLRQGRGSLFTPAQRDTFPQWAAHGVGVWVLKGASDHEYNKLMQPPNWHLFL